MLLANYCFVLKATPCYVTVTKNNFQMLVYENHVPSLSPPPIFVCGDQDVGLPFKFCSAILVNQVSIELLQL